MTERNWDWRGFWVGLPTAEQRILRLFLLAALGVVGWALGGWLLRHDFGEALIPFAFQEERIEAIQTVEIQHRRYLLEVPVRWAYEVSAADLLIPARWAVAVAWVLMVIGWGALLTATTRMQGFWPYLVYFAWVSWVFLSRAAEFWAGVNPLYIVSLGLSMGALLPAYLIQSGVWRLPLRFTGLFLTALVAFVLGLPTLWKGSVVLHDTLTYPGILSLAASLFVTLQAAIAWGAIGVYALSRARSGIAGYVLWAGVMGGVVGLLVFLPMDAAVTLALGLALIGGVLGFSGLQPFYPLWGEAFRQPAAFFWGWSGLLLLAGAPLGYHGLVHQDLYTYRIASLAWGVLLLGVGLMAVYVGANFWPLWKARRMQYWDLAKSTRIPLALVYFGQIAGAAFFEARADWPTSRFPARLYAILKAESALVAGDLDAAQSAYQEAAVFLPYEPKINYNLARIQSQDPNAAEAASERYERALLSKPFLPAALQASLVWLALDRPVRAIQLLQSYYHRFGGGAVLCNQLAFAFYKGGQLDSAAYYWKEAIAADPADPAPYLHLAVLYAQNGRLSWATKVAQTALQKASTFSTVSQENLVYLRLLGLLDTLPEGMVSRWNSQWLGAVSDTTPVGRFVAAVRSQQLAAAEGFLPYFREQDAELLPYLARYLAVAFLREGLPRKAAEVFFSAGTPLDSLYGGYALADAGCLEGAYKLLSRLWVSYPAMEEEGRREAALLLAGSGLLSEASFLYPPSEWKDADYLRFTQYGYHQKHLQTLVLVLRPWVDRGAAYDEPYEVVARLFLLQRDTAGAEENLQAGLSRVPNSVRLRLAYAELDFLRGDSAAGRAKLDSAAAYMRQRSDSLLWLRARLRWQPTEVGLLALRQQFPLDPVGQVAWTRKLLQKGQAQAAYDFLSGALDVNPYDAGLWQAYAEAAQALGLLEEAQFARTKPDPCPPAL